MLLDVQDMRLDLQEKEAAFLELIADLQQKKGEEQKAGIQRGQSTHHLCTLSDKKRAMAVFAIMGHSHKGSQIGRIQLIAHGEKGGCICHRNEAVLGTATTLP